MPGKLHAGGSGARGPVTCLTAGADLLALGSSSLDPGPPDGRVGGLPVPLELAGGRMSKAHLTALAATLVFGAFAPRLAAQDTSSAGVARPDTSGYTGAGGVDTSAGRFGDTTGAAVTDTSALQADSLGTSDTSGMGGRRPDTTNPGSTVSPGASPSGGSTSPSGSSTEPSGTAAPSGSSTSPSGSSTSPPESSTSPSSTSPAGTSTSP